MYMSNLNSSYNSKKSDHSDKGHKWQSMEITKEFQNYITEM